MKNEKLQLYVFLTLLLVVGGLTFLIFLPYLPAFAVAAVFAVLFAPLHRQVRRLLRNETISALVTVVLVSCIILIPIGFFGVLLFQEVTSLSKNVTAGGYDVFQKSLAPLEAHIKNYLPVEVSFSFRQIFVDTLTWVTHNLGGAFAGTAQFMLQAFIGLFAFFYFLKDGKKFLQTAIQISPLDDLYDQEILERMHLGIVSVIRGSLTAAFLQGVCASIGFTIFHIPNPVFWGGVAMLAALVPTLGTSIVVAPAVAYLFITGQQLSSIGLLIFGVACIGSIDNFIGPRLVGRGMQIHPLFILFAVVGGISMFGPVGVLLGPLVLSLLFALSSIYIRFSKKMVN